MLVLPRYTQPEKDHLILLHQLHLDLPVQPQPRMVEESPIPAARKPSVVKTY